MILRNLHIVGDDYELRDIYIKGEIFSGIIPANSPAIPKNNSEDIILNFKDCIAFPGLINSHDHLEFNLYPQLGHKIYQDYVEWGDDIHLMDKKLIEKIEAIPVELRIQSGILKNLLCGVTAVAHHGDFHPCMTNSPITVLRKFLCVHSVKAGGKWKLKLYMKKSAEPIVIHIGEGINKDSKAEIDELIRWNLIKRKLIGVHGIAMDSEQAKKFEALVWCPVSNFFLFGKTADIQSFKNYTRILFGTDSTLTSGWNLWDHLREADESDMLTKKGIFNSLTNVPAETWGLKDYGIKRNMGADIVIAKQKSDKILDSFFLTNPEDILLIVKNGKIILFDESLKSQLPEELNFKEINKSGVRKFISYNFDQDIFSDFGFTNSF